MTVSDLVRDLYISWQSAGIRAVLFIHGPVSGASESMSQDRDRCGCVREHVQGCRVCVCSRAEERAGQEDREVSSSNDWIFHGDSKLQNFSFSSLNSHFRITRARCVHSKWLNLL